MKIIKNLLNIIKNNKIKSNLNLILSFDFINNLLQISNYNVKTSSFNKKQFSLNSDVTSKDFALEISTILTDYIADYPLNTAKNCFIILPDSAITINSVTLPVIKGSGQNNALISSIEKEYNNVNTLAIKHYIVERNKKTLTYCIASLSNQIIQNIKSGLNKANFACNAITFNSNCITNYVNNLLDYKKKSLLFVNIGKNMSTYIAINCGRTVAFSQIEIGYASFINELRAEENFLEILKWAQAFSQNTPSFNFNRILDEIVFNIPSEFTYLVENLQRNNANYRYSLFTKTPLANSENIALLGSLNIDTELNFYEKI